MSDVGICLRDERFWSDLGVVNLHRKKDTHWVAYINQNYFNSFGFSPPQKLSRVFIKQNGHFLYFEHKLQGLTCERDSYCASQFFYINYSEKFLGIDFISTVLYLY